MRRQLAATSVAVLGIAAFAVGTANTGAQAASPPSRATAGPAATAKLGPGGRVIVLLKNHTTSFNAHTAATRQAARTGRSQVSAVAAQITRGGGRVTGSYALINGVAATVSQGQADALAADPSVQEVVPDEPIRADAAPTAAPAPVEQPPIAPPANTCRADGGVQLDPQALEATRADSDQPGAKTARSLGYTGKGVTVGWIADGIDINNPEFIRDGKSIFTDYQDFGGDGTNSPTGGGEAFLDASAIAAQGNQTYDISKFSYLPLSTACKIRIEGEAPGVNLVGLNIFGDEDTGFNSSFIQAIQYATTVDHVNVLNESLGNNYYPDDSGSLDAVKAANDAATAQGVTITASSGDAGVTNTIGTPATDPNVISVGASTTYRLDLQTGYGGAHLPGVTGWLDDNISSLSSSGFEQDGRTIDLLAPGELNWTACTADAKRFAECVDYRNNPSNVQASGGTSESAPVVAGVAALVIEAYRSGHGGASPTPAIIKSILTSTADDVRSPAELQGAGLVDAYKAVQLARSYHSATRTGDTVATSAGQFTAVSAASTSHRFRETVTNEGTAVQTVTASTRTLGDYRQIKTATVTLSDANSPKYVDFQGITDNVEKVTFTVPPGVDRLDASIAFKNASITDLAARVRMTLVDPKGRLASYSLPQGNGNYGDGQVADPTAGRWTAYVQSRVSANGGTQGAVVFGARTASFASFGSVSPRALTLAPGHSGTVTVTAATPKSAGDIAGSLLLRTGTTTPGLPATTTVPITLRSLIPLGRHSFRDTLRGGNGRATFTGQTFYYDIDLPAGDPALNADITLAHDPRNTFYAWLIAPNGNAQASASNQRLTSLGGGTEPAAASTLGAQLHVLTPSAGRWTLIVTFAPQVSGTALSEPFTVATNEAAAVASVSSTRSLSIRSGTVRLIHVTVKNTGTSPESFFLDPRLTSTSAYELAPLTSATSTAPLHMKGSIPEFLVPTRTSVIAATSRTSGARDIQFDASAPTGDPDGVSDVGKTVSARYEASPVTQGVWAVAPTEVGPFPTAGQAESVTTTAAARTRTFDPDVRTATGDLWLTAIDPQATLDTVTALPGQTVTIPVAIHATGKPRTVRGTIYLDDADLFIVGEIGTGAPGTLSPNGNEVAALPYSYTVR